MRTVNTKIHIEKHTLNLHFFVKSINAIVVNGAMMFYLLIH